MNDQDHHEQEDAAKSRVELENQELVAFTRQFGGDAKPIPTPAPIASDKINISDIGWPPAPGPSGAPGDFTRLFSTASPADASADSNTGNELPFQRGGPPGDFTKLFGTGNVQIPEVRKSGFQLDEGPGPSITASPAAETFPSRYGFPELKNPARLGGSQAQDNLEPFRHSPAAPESVDLKLSGVPPSEISGGDVPPSGYTRLFSEPPPAAGRRPVPFNTIDFRGPQLRTTPSDYTRVVSGKDAEAALSASPSTPPPSAGLPLPAAPMPGFPQIPSPALPAIPPAQVPPVPPGYPPHFHMQYVPAAPPPMPPAPQMPSSPVLKTTAPSAETPSSKWIAYIPVLIAFNVLFAIAVLIILFFALRK